MKYYVGTGRFTNKELTEDILLSLLPSIKKQIEEQDKSIKEIKKSLLALEEKFKSFGTPENIKSSDNIEIEKPKKKVKKESAKKVEAEEKTL